MTDLPWPGDSRCALEKEYHAIGVVTTEWDLTESAFRLAMAAQLGILGTAGFAVFTHVGNRTLADTMRTIAVEIETNDAIREHLLHAAKLYGICLTNRNLMCHQSLMPIGLSEGELAVTHKFTAKGKFKSNLLLVPLEEIRAIADEVTDFRRYLNDLLLILSQRKDEGMPESWPEKPALPKDRNQTLRVVDLEYLRLRNASHP